MPTPTDPTPVWKGKRLATWGDIAEAMEKIQTEAEGREFMTLMRSTNPKCADQNARYIAGYYSAATAKRMCRLLGL